MKDFLQRKAQGPGKLTLIQLLLIQREQEQRKAFKGKKPLRFLTTLSSCIPWKPKKHANICGYLKMENSP